VKNRRPQASEDFIPPAHPNAIYPSTASFCSRVPADTDTLHIATWCIAFFFGRRDKSHRCQAGRFGRKTPRAGEPWSLSLVSLGAPSHGHIPSRFSVGKERRRGKTWGFAVRAFVLRAMTSSSHRFERGREEERHNPRKWSFLVLRHMYV
jgi:hypothetical protein